MNTNKLKPCPFCGGKANLTYMNDAEDIEKTIAVMCEHCGASSVCLPSFFSAVNEITNSWNRRFAPQPSSDPPTEPGLYLVQFGNTKYLFSAIIEKNGNDLMMAVPHFIQGEELLRIYQTTVSDIAAEYSVLQWSKIEEPKIVKTI